MTPRLFAPLPLLLTLSCSGSSDSPPAPPVPTRGAAPAVGPDGQPIGPAQPPSGGAHNPNSGKLVGPPVPDGLSREGEGGPHHLELYLDPDSRAFSQRARVVATLGELGLGSGAVVADIGAGSGFFTWPLSDLVGTGGRVIAVDIDQEAIAFMTERLGTHPTAHKNLEFVLSKPDDITLPAASLDWGLMVDAHFFLPAEGGVPDPAAIACIESVYRALRPGGRLAVIEFRDNPAAGGEVPKAWVTGPFEGVGLQVESEFDWLEREYFLVFRKPAAP